MISMYSWSFSISLYFQLIEDKCLVFTEQECNRHAFSLNQLTHLQIIQLRKIYETYLYNYVEPREMMISL